MVYERVRGWTSGRSLPVQNFVKYSPPPPLGWSFMMFVLLFLIFRLKVKALCALTCDEADATCFVPKQLAATNYTPLNSLLYMNRSF